MSYKIPSEDGRTLNEPLLSVNPSSTGFTIIKTPTVPMKQEIRGTWHKLKLSMILIFAITILAVATLIYGCIKVAQAANDDINNGAALNQDISMFLFSQSTSHSIYTRPVSPQLILNYCILKSLF